MNEQEREALVHIEQFWAGAGQRMAAHDIAYLVALCRRLESEQKPAARTERFEREAYLEGWTTARMRGYLLSAACSLSGQVGS